MVPMKTLFVLMITSGITMACLDEASQPSQDAMAEGKKVYDKTCLTCHQKNGAGVPNLNASLIKSPVVNGEKNRLINVVLLGSEKAGVHDEEYSNPMPAQAYMTNQEIANVLTYVRNSFGNKGIAVTAAEVKKLRK
jgi:mono/diheme cytochrome c family protein